MIRKMPKERRQKRRGSICLPVSCAETGGPDEEKKKPCEGTVADLSESGLGIFTNREIEHGTVLEIECRDLWESPRKFRVMWSNRIEFNFYRVGLEALQKEQSIP